MPPEQRSLPLKAHCFGKLLLPCPAALWEVRIKATLPLHPRCARIVFRFVSRKFPEMLSLIRSRGGELKVVRHQSTTQYTKLHTRNAQTKLHTQLQTKEKSLAIEALGSRFRTCCLAQNLSLHCSSSSSSLRAVLSGVTCTNSQLPDVPSSAFLPADLFL